MKKQLFFGAIVSLLMASCSSELDIPVNQVLEGEGNTPLNINVVANHVTKALVSGTVLPNNSQIGVKLVDAGGSTYDSQTYNNIFYSTTDGNSWTIDGTKSIMLSATEGKAYAYYPYSADGSDFTAIPIESADDPTNQIDYMYGNVASGLKNSNPTASFTMSHAMSIVNFEIAQGSYTGTGSITSVKMKGNTASNTGTMNAEAGTVTATNKGYEFTSTNSLTLGNSSAGKFIVVPSGESSKLDFKLVMDGQTYTASTTTAVTLQSGKVYKYTLTMNSTGLSVNTVTVTPWDTEQDKGSLDTELFNPWTIASDGVYAIDNAGNPVDYTTASAAASGTYKGVALVMNGKAIEIATANASGDTKWVDASLTTDQQAIFSSYYITKVDGTNSSGYLKMPDGTYHSNSTESNRIPDDISTWTDGALNDVDGKANTDRIIAAGVTIASVFSSYNNGDHGSTSWYLPAAGQLAYMYMNYDKINNLLPKVSGTALSTSHCYWSSSVYSADYVWCVDFGRGRVNSGHVEGTSWVRLVRDL